MAKHFSKLLIILTVTSLSLVSCSKTTPNNASVQELSSSPVAAKSSIDVSNDALASAEHYLSLAAKSTPPQSYEYQLLAASMYVSAREYSQAQHWINEVPIGGLSSRLKVHKKILSAKIALYSEQPALAIEKLKTVTSLSRIAKSQHREVLEIRAEAYRKMDQPIESARMLSQLDEILLEPNARKENRDALWQSLRNVTPDELKRAIESDDESQFKGWVALALVLRTQDVSFLSQTLAQWQSAYPGHPAVDYVPGMQRRSAPRSANLPDQIALLLPLSGTHQKAAEAIRDGFLTRYYANDFNFANKPRIQVYDTTTVEDIQALYYEAVNDGAKLVIGPLMKQNVLELSKISRARAPILALNENKAIQRAPRNFYQFALAPEDEAEQIAEKAASMQFKNAAIVVPNNNWGQRIIEAFSNRYQSLGGHLVKAVKVSANEDQAKAIRDLLNIESSQQRSIQVKYSIREKVHLQPRRRQDLDVIVLAAPPEQARQLKPLFNFYFAQNLPVLATSSVYAGKPTPAKDQDMNGVIFCDMPWLLLRDKKSYATKALITHHWPQEANLYARLFAMGVDAYDLSSQLETLRAFPHNQFQGATGYLSLTPRHQIDRRLVWAKFDKGMPELLP